jgi:glutaredoxin
VQSYIKHGKVVLWTETKADPQSKVETLKMKRILGEQNIDFEEINITESRYSDNLKLGLSMITGYNSFPNVFFGKEHIGGVDDI